MNHPLLSKSLQFRLINLSDLENINALHSLPETDEFKALGVPENLKETNAIVRPWILENEKDTLPTIPSLLKRK